MAYLQEGNLLLQKENTVKYYKEGERPLVTLLCHPKGTGEIVREWMDEGSGYNWDIKSHTTKRTMQCKREEFKYE